MFRTLKTTVKPAYNHYIYYTTSTTMNHATTLLFAGLSAISCSFCHKQSTAQTFERTQDKVLRKGCDFEFSRAIAALFAFTNQATGEQQLRLSGTIVKPVKLNGEKVATEVNSTASFQQPAENFREYVFANLYDHLCKLSDGIYTLNLRDILIDKKGKIAYFGYEGVRNPSRSSLVPLDMQLCIFDELCALLEKAKFEPGKRGAQKVISYYDDKDIWEATFKITDHQLYVSKG